MHTILESIDSNVLQSLTSTYAWKCSIEPWSFLLVVKRPCSTTIYQWIKCSVVFFLWNIDIKTWIRLTNLLNTGQKSLDQHFQKILIGQYFRPTVCETVTLIACTSHSCSHTSLHFNWDPFDLDYEEILFGQCEKWIVRWENSFFLLLFFVASCSFRQRKAKTKIFQNSMISIKTNSPLVNVNKWKCSLFKSWRQITVLRCLENPSTTSDDLSSKGQNEKVSQKDKAHAAKSDAFDYDQNNNDEVTIDDDDEGMFDEEEFESVKLKKENTFRTFNRFLFLSFSGWPKSLIICHAEFNNHRDSDKFDWKSMGSLSMWSCHDNRVSSLFH